ncbi:MAG: class I SAM-dependent methyltransferase [Pseudomonadota bacterium]
MATLFDRLHYRAGQTARFGVFTAAYLASRRFAPYEEAQTREPSEGYPPPSRADLTAALQEAFTKDWQHIAEGYYRKPADLLLDPRETASRLVDYFQDLPKVTQRRKDHGHSEVLQDDLRDDYPRYYLQNFHYQSDGWLSDRSARIYDTQVDVLFTGSADAMRRLALVPLSTHMRGRDQRKINVLDVACGTGRLSYFIKQNYPRVNLTSLDLSPNYLDEARRTLQDFSRVSFLNSPVEAMPLPDASQDVVTSVYLFHELPPKIRSEAAHEIARVLKPGGIYIHTDSIQIDDKPALNALLEHFPVAFHEPYYAGYVREDLGQLFGEAGLVQTWTDIAFLTKSVAFQKQAS